MLTRLLSQAPCFNKIINSEFFDIIFNIKSPD